MLWKLGGDSRACDAICFIGRVWKPDVQFVLQDLTADYSPDSKIITGIKKQKEG